MKLNQSILLLNSGLNSDDSLEVMPLGDSPSTFASPGRQNVIIPPDNYGKLEDAWDAALLATTADLNLGTKLMGQWHRRDRIWIIAHSLNRADRTIGGQGGEAEGIPCECGEAGCARMPCGTGGEVQKQDTSNSDCQYGKKLFRGNKLGDETKEGALGRSHKINGGQWHSEPSVGRVANGIPNRVDRLKGLGNAIVPQVALEVFKAIEQYELSLPR